MKVNIKKTSIEKLREAWDKMPPGAKNKLYADFGHTSQNVADVLKNGRKDEQVIITLLKNVKAVSKSIFQEIEDKNKKVQAL